MTPRERQQASAIRKLEEWRDMALNRMISMGVAFAEAIDARGVESARPSLSLIKEEDASPDSAERWLASPDSGELDRRAQAEIASAKSRGEELSYIEALRRLTGG